MQQGEAAAPGPLFCEIHGSTFTGICAGGSGGFLTRLGSDLWQQPELYLFAGNSDIQWCFSQVKGTLDDDVTEGELQ